MPRQLFLAGRFRTTSVSATYSFAGWPWWAASPTWRNFPAPQGGANPAQRRRFPIPFHTPVVAPHQVFVSGGIPPAVVVYRVGFAVDDVQNRLVQTPGEASAHRRQNLLQMRHIRRSSRPRTEDAAGCLQMHFHRGQRTPVGPADQKRRSQFVTNVGLVRQLDDIPLAFAVRQLAPIMHQQHKVRLGGVGPAATHLAKRLGQRRQADALVVQEPPRCLCGGKSRRGTGKTRHPSSQVSRRTHVRVYQCQKTSLQSPVQRREGNPLHPRKLRHFRKCVDTNG